MTVLKAKTQAQTEELERLKTEMAQAKQAHTEQLGRLNAEMDQATAQHNEQINVLEEQIDGFESEKIDLLKRLQTLGNNTSTSGRKDIGYVHLNALVNEINNIERTIIFLKSEVQRLQQEKESLEKQKADIQQQLNNCEAENSKFKRS